MLEGSAESLPFDDESFDGTSIAFGIRNVPDRARALREMGRVTRKGGRIAILELSEPRKGPLASLARFHVHTLVPRVGAFLSRAPEYRYLEQSIAKFPPAEEFEALMVEAGLVVRQIVSLTSESRPVLFIVDEILQGTNSHDRRVGVEAVLRSLLDRGAIGLITTHDLALAEIADALAPRARNVHFADHLEDGRMVFDYRLRDGRRYRGGVGRDPGVDVRALPLAGAGEPPGTPAAARRGVTP